MGRLSEALERSLAAMKWLAPSDAALVAQARLLARQTDALFAAGATMPALRYMTVLGRVLGDLGGRPRVRMQYELRSLRLAQPETAGKLSSTAAEQSNVTRLERPAKRKS